MFQSHITIRRIALAVLFLATALSAQRYSGHDHAVFHRPPQPPSAGVKHQTPPPANATTNRTKPTTATSASSQQGSRAAAGQGKLDVETNHGATPAKTDPPLDNAPRF